MLGDDQVFGADRIFDNHHAQQWTSTEIERPSELLRRDLIDIAGRHRRNVDRYRGDDRDGVVEHRMRERRSQIGIPLQQRSRRDRQGTPVDHPIEGEPMLNVIVVPAVARPGRGLEVHTPLQRGQRMHLLPARVVTIEEHTRVLVQFDQLRLRRGLRSRLLSTADEFGKRGRIEHVGNGEVHSPGCGRRYEAHGRDAVSTGREKAGLRVHDGAEHLGGRSEKRTRLRDLHGRAGRGYREGVAVELAVQRARQCLDDGDRLWHELIRQGSGQLGPHRCRVDSRRIHSRRIVDDVPEQPRRAVGDLGDLRRRIADTVQRTQGSLHLTEFDAESAHLHLIVGAAEVFETIAAAPDSVDRADADRR